MEDSQFSIKARLFFGNHEDYLRRVLTGKGEIRNSEVAIFHLDTMFSGHIMITEDLFQKLQLQKKGVANYETTNGFTQFAVLSQIAVGLKDLTQIQSYKNAKQFHVEILKPILGPKNLVGMGGLRKLQINPIISFQLAVSYNDNSVQVQQDNKQLYFTGEIL